MPRKRHSTEQIIHKLREAEVELSKGQTTKEICRKLAITGQACYRSPLSAGLRVTYHHGWETPTRAPVA